MSLCTARYISFCLVFLPVLLISTGDNVNADSLYTLENLGSLGTGAALTTGINSSGAAVGFTTDPYGNSIPTVFNGQANALPGYGEASGINSSGTIIGTTYLNSGTSVTEWSNGKANNLGIAGYGTAINDAGQVAGGMQTASGQLHAFVWTNCTLVDLGTLNGGTWSSATGINASGEIVGTSLAGSTFSAFFSNGTSLTQINNTLGGASSYGMAINGKGVAVGSAQTSSGYLNAFESNGTGMIDIGTLGGSMSSAYGINDAGTVVGYSLTSGNTATHGFVYSNGVLLDLNSLLPIGSGWTIDAAYGINSAGDILGVGTFNNQLYAVQLLPSGDVLSTGSEPLATPEPAALLLTGAGLIVIGKLRRSKRKPKTAL